VAVAAVKDIAAFQQGHGRARYLQNYHVEINKLELSLKVIEKTK
jgi:hypothetical protein